MPITGSACREQRRRRRFLRREALPNSPNCDDFARDFAAGRLHHDWRIRNRFDENLAGLQRQASGFIELEQMFCSLTKSVPPSAEKLNRRFWPASVLTSCPTSRVGLRFHRRAGSAGQAAAARWCRHGQAPGRRVRIGRRRCARETETHGRCDGDDMNGPPFEEYILRMSIRPGKKRSGPAWIKNG